jgi:hypothetical protein
MCRRANLLVLLSVSFLTLPFIAYAGGIPFFGPIIPETNNVCPAGWGMLMVVINNIISLLITLAIVFFAPIRIAYAGFLYVINPINPSERQKANGILLSTIVGIVIALASWMIVDAVMAVLYDPKAVGKTWSELITSGGADICLKQAGSAPGAGFNPVTGVTVTPSGNAYSFGSGACDPTVLQRALPSLTLSQANTFACLAKPESTCGTVMQNYSWNVPNKDGLASTAYGAFQVTLSGNHACFENAACRTAAGVSGLLNCQKGFTPKGFTAGGDATILAYCTKAAANLDCNIAAAACVLNKQGWGAWTADSRSSAQAQCIAQFAN